MAKRSEGSEDRIQLNVTLGKPLVRVLTVLAGVLTDGNRSAMLEAVLVEGLRGEKFAPRVKKLEEAGLI